MNSKVLNYQSSDQSANLQQSAQNKALDNLSSNPLNGGSLLAAVALNSGSNSVSHKLGRKLQGYIVVGQSAAASIYQESADTTILKLNASAPVSVTLFVF